SELGTGTSDMDGTPKEVRKTRALVSPGESPGHERSGTEDPVAAATGQVALVEEEAQQLEFREPRPHRQVFPRIEIDPARQVVARPALVAIGEVGPADQAVRGRRRYPVLAAAAEGEVRRHLMVLAFGIDRDLARLPLRQPFGGLVLHDEDEDEHARRLRR